MRRQTHREAFLAVICLLFLLAYFMISRLILSGATASGNINPIIVGTLGALAVIMVLCTCLHLFGYNQLIVNGLLDVVDNVVDKEKTKKGDKKKTKEPITTPNFIKCKICGHLNYSWGQNCINCNNPLNE